MLRAAIEQRNINPAPGVELAGWGYYLERTWNDIRDDLQATALVVSDARATVILISLDMMVIDRSFTAQVRDSIHAQTDVPPDAILVCCTHSHNAPAAGGLLGVGACDQRYEQFAAARAVEAAVAAWRNQQPVTLQSAASSVTQLTFNRTRPNGETDTSLVSSLLSDQLGNPVAVVVNFAAHPTLLTEALPTSVSRDLPGMVCRQLEEHFSGARAVYLQGACGDTNFLKEFKHPDRWHEPAGRIVQKVVDSLSTAAIRTEATVRHTTESVWLPTRRWTKDEIDADRQEALRRSRDRDYTGWEETIGRSMTNRPADMVRRHGGSVPKAVAAMCRFQIEWTDLMLQDWSSRPESLNTEVQALRFGPLTVVSNGCEFFAPFANRLRKAYTADSPDGHLMIACYANDRIGYLPDAYDIAAKSYAAWQSPKYCNQFPFVDRSGDVMTDAMQRTIQLVKNEDS